MVNGECMCVACQVYLTKQKHLRLGCDFSSCQKKKKLNLNGHKFNNLWIIVINHGGYHITLTNFNMSCSVKPSKYNTSRFTNTHKSNKWHTRNPGWIPQIKPVSVESKTKKKLYPFFLSVIYKCTHANTHRCFHEALPEIWEMRVSVRSQQIKGGCHRETLILWIINTVWLVSVATAHRTRRYKFKFVSRVIIHHLARPQQLTGRGTLVSTLEWHNNTHTPPLHLPADYPLLQAITRTIFIHNLPSRVINTHTHSLPFFFPIRPTTSRPGLYCCQATQRVHHAPAVGYCYWPHSQQEETRSTKWPFF